ncbi:General control protein [Lodderomyces elongisporus]|uniref:General control protein n=1 Tax=Lodderomyces elongisporus TaxID=36914 RepID=UPI002923D706|nr:General control protein [Lodderomyces elongisporus]WLF79623.1 General control protein [Lodderomyces elongisporus]
MSAATTTTITMQNNQGSLIESAYRAAPTEMTSDVNCAEAESQREHVHEREVASPFQIHSSVLDSVFSTTNLDGKDAMLDHTPMFDELDFIVDGINVNSKDDWVALFGEGDEGSAAAAATAAASSTASMFAGEGVSADAVCTNGPIIDLGCSVSAEARTESGDVKHGIFEDSMLEALLAEPSPNGLSDETISAATTSASSPEVDASTVCTSVAPSTSSANGRKRSFKEVEQTQLFTPNPSSTLPTPQLDVKKSSSLSSSSSSNKKARVDHLGCVAYSKKQRSQTLEPIDFSGIEDVSALKRAKNTEAARRSRARKMERMTQLENRVGELMAENDDLKKEVERLRALLS